MQIVFEALTLLMHDHRKVKALFLEYEARTSRSAVQKKALARTICHALAVHAQLEEEIFYPAAGAAIEGDNLFDEVLIHHASAKELIAQIESMDPGDKLYDTKMHVLSGLIAHHIAKEEGQIFPIIRASCLDLVAIGEDMAAFKDEI